MWGGRFQQGPSPLFERFNNSFSFDYRLLPFDVQGSLAYCKALERAGILTAPESKKLQRALRNLVNRIAARPRTLRDALPQFEDVHSFVEAQLVAAVGDLGKKIHTGRSRNDQVALDLKLYLRSESKGIRERLLLLLRTLTQNAEKHLDVILPGYTHLQRAQPIRLAHYWLAYFEMLVRDLERLESCSRRMNTLPLGSGALAGSGFPIDRQFLARELGFRRPTRNSLDAVSDRDHVAELLSCLAILMMHLSRLAEDLILFSTAEFHFVELSDAVSSGSSLMPQKKNPDSLELIRGKTGRVYGNLLRLLVVMKGLPLAYNKDMQEDKEAVFDTVDTVFGSLEMATLVLQTLKLDSHAMARAALASHANATDCADYLAQKGLPFRKAHELTGKIVRYALQKGVPLEELELHEFRSFSPLFNEDVRKALTLERAVESKAIEGGVARKFVQKAINNAKHVLAQIE
ncbi:MAG: argininosuccinate lyase [Acidobacteriia bacterium]|nr:argininosuccinate lyase [Terriglobia bacterium]